MSEKQDLFRTSVYMEEWKEGHGFITTFQIIETTQSTLDLMLDKFTKIKTIVEERA